MTASIFARTRLLIVIPTILTGGMAPVMADDSPGEAPQEVAQAAGESGEVAVDLDSLEEEEAVPQKAENTGQEEEVAIDLDALEEEDSSSEKAGFVIPDEPMLPIEITEVELKKQPLLKLWAALVLLPAAAMLFRARRKTRRSTQKDSRKET